MKSHALVILASLTLGLAVSQPLAGRHSLALFDTSNPVQLTGTITQVKWASPVNLYLEVKDEKGVSLIWDLDLPANHVLMTRGITQEKLRKGETLTIEVYPLKPASVVPPPQNGPRDRVGYFRSIIRLGTETFTTPIR